MRATTGKKLYHNETNAGPLPPTKINDLTQNSKQRQKILYRAENGVPLQKTNRNVEFVPPSIAAAKKDIEAANFGLFDDEYDLKRQHDYYTHEMKKQKQLHGHFKKSNYFDNGTQVDQFGCVMAKSRSKNPAKTGTMTDQGSNRSQSNNPNDNLETK